VVVLVDGDDVVCKGRDAGFTLAELAVVVAIIGVLVTISVASYAFTTTRSQAATCAVNRRVFDLAASAFAADHGSAPGDIDDLRPYVRNFDRVVTCPADEGVRLRWDAAARSTVCDLHEQ
jgi:prepilin-type N-terminal cleavage/methylation domain-containing protein